jgi:hypothetical protein
VESNDVKATSRRYEMLTEKRPLSVEEIDAQAALELPDREMMLVTVVITNLLNNNEVSIDVRNIDIAAQICANALANNSNVDCEIQQ